MATEVEQRAWYAARTKQMYDMHQGGSTFAQIARVYALSRERVRQCVFRHKEVLTEVKEGNTLIGGRMVYAELAVRSRNCLKNEGIEDLEELRDWTGEQLLRVPNFGRKSLDQMQRECTRLGITIGWNRRHD